MLILSNFVPPVWKLHNPYCHNLQWRVGTILTISPNFFCLFSKKNFTISPLESIIYSYFTELIEWSYPYYTSFFFQSFPCFLFKTFGRWGGNIIYSWIVLWVVWMLKRRQWFCLPSWLTISDLLRLLIFKNSFLLMSSSKNFRENSGENSTWQYCYVEKIEE